MICALPASQTAVASGAQSRQDASRSGIPVALSNGSWSWPPRRMRRYAAHQHARLLRSLRPDGEFGDVLTGGTMLPEEALAGGVASAGAASRSAQGRPRLQQGLQAG